jgi:hypothetical protein
MREQRSAENRGFYEETKIKSFPLYHHLQLPVKIKSIITGI